MFKYLNYFFITLNQIGKIMFYFHNLITKYPLRGRSRLWWHVLRIILRDESQAVGNIPLRNSSPTLNPTNPTQRNPTLITKYTNASCLEHGIIWNTREYACCKNEICKIKKNIIILGNISFCEENILLLHQNFSTSLNIVKMHSA